MSKSSAVELFSTKLSTTTIHKSGQQPAISEPSALELLSVELFAAILHNITLKSDLNALSRSSRALYHRTTPELYKSWSYPRLGNSGQKAQKLDFDNQKPLKNFLETLESRPDPAAYVKDLDLRGWGDAQWIEGT